MAFGTQKYWRFSLFVNSATPLLRISTPTTPYSYDSAIFELSSAGSNQNNKPQENVRKPTILSLNLAAKYWSVPGNTEELELSSMLSKMNIRASLK